MIFPVSTQGGEKTNPDLVNKEIKEHIWDGNGGIYASNG